MGWLNTDQNNSEYGNFLKRCSCEHIKFIPKRINIDMNHNNLIEMVFSWSFIKRQTRWYIEWQRVTMTDNEWYNEWQRMKRVKMNDKNDRNLSLKHTKENLSKLEEDLLRTTYWNKSRNINSKKQELRFLPRSVPVTLTSIHMTFPINAYQGEGTSWAQ